MPRRVKIKLFRNCIVRLAFVASRYKQESFFLGESIEAREIIEQRSRIRVFSPLLFIGTMSNSLKCRSSSFSTLENKLDAER